MRLLSEEHLTLGSDQSFNLHTKMNEQFINQHLTDQHSGHKVADLRILFDECFKASYNTILVTGAEEPIYLPPDRENIFARVVSTKDYFSSALHEISHWCIAGDARRKLVDYGYWYEPDGRTSEQQALFEKVEVKPQALEWCFAKACGIKFRVSADNLNNPEAGCCRAFKEAIVVQARRYAQQYKDGLLNVRAKVFIDRLLKHYSLSANASAIAHALVTESFVLDEI